jgi:DNA polymerase-3 subunit beta
VKLTVRTGQFRTAFNDVAPVVPKRTPHDILRNVKAQCVGGMLILTATDNEITATAEVTDVQCSGDGEFLIPTERVTRILSAVDADELCIDAKDKKLRMKFPGAEFQIALEDSKDFPPNGLFAVKQELSVKTRSLRRAMQQTVFAADMDSTRYALAGVHLEISRKGIVAVATDSRRLAVSQVETWDEPQEKWSLSEVIPLKAVNRLIAMLDDASEDVVLQIGDNRMRFSVGSKTLVAPFVQGRFPKWRQIADAVSGVYVNVGVEPLVSAIRQVSAISTKEERRTRFTLSDKELSLHYTAEENAGDADTAIPIETVMTDPVSVWLDSLYMLAGLNAMKPETTALMIVKDHNNAVELKTHSGQYRYIVMPMIEEQ